jgi:two-component system, cell cycle response regulator DivK
MARRPAQQRGDQSASSSSTQPRPRAPRQAPLILIADDTTDVRSLYAEYFSARGFRVVTAHDGATAVDVALQLLPDVIVMDLAMPQIDGVTAIRRIRAAERDRPACVILLTGYPGKAVERGALEAGADRFLTKPCLPEDLERHVRELGRERRSR